MCAERAAAIIQCRRVIAVATMLRVRLDALGVSAMRAEAKLAAGDSLGEVGLGCGADFAALAQRLVSSVDRAETLIDFGYAGELAKTG